MLVDGCWSGLRNLIRVLNGRPCSGVIIAPDLSRQGYFDDAAGFAQAYATPDAYPAAMTFKNSL
jgi:hypothetical protein